MKPKGPNILFFETAPPPPSQSLKVSKFVDLLWQLQRYYESRQQRRGLCRQKGVEIIDKVFDVNRLQKLLHNENGSCGSLLPFTRVGYSVTWPNINNGYYCQRKHLKGRGRQPVPMKCRPQKVGMFYVLCFCLLPQCKFLHKLLGSG